MGVGRDFCVVLLACSGAWHAVHAAIPVQVLLPLTGDNCELGNQYRAVAELVNAENGWPLRLTYNDTAISAASPDDDATSSESGSESGFLANDAISANQRGLGGDGDGAAHVVLGPVTGAAVQLAQVAARHFRVPLVAVDSASPRGTSLAYTTRTSASAPNYGAALVGLIHHYRWKQFALLRTADAHGAAFAEAAMGTVASLAGAGRATGGVGVALHELFTPSSVDPALFALEADAALTRIARSGARVILLSAHPSDAAALLRRASSAAHGMVGKGWVWLGDEWASDYTFHDTLTHDASSGPAAAAAANGAAIDGDAASGKGAEGAQLRFAMEGLVGAVSGRDPPAFDDLQARLSAAGTGPNATLPPAPYNCSAFDAATARWDAPLLPFVHDAVWLLATHVASCPAARLVGDGGGTAADADAARANIYSLLRNSSDPASPVAGCVGGALRSKLTGPYVTDRATGQRVGTRLDFVNLQRGRVGGGGGRGGFVLVGTFVSQSNALADLLDPSPAAAAAARGLLSPPRNGAVVWPGSSTEVPSAVGPTELDYQAQYFLLVFVGLCTAFIWEALLHKHHVMWVPGSGAVILSGVLYGALLKVLGSREMIEGAEFKENIFALVLLPIIIFASGYALNASFFLNQLGSILMYGLVGTCITTFFGGFVLFYWGNAALRVHDMSIEECLAFSACINSVDPVATLATFGALKVDPKLHALVYGESVFTDAMVIVLYRTFTSFFFQPVTEEAVDAAVLKFFWIAGGAFLFGLIISVLAALTLKHFPLFGSPVVESLCVLAFSYFAFLSAESFHLSGIVASLTAGIAMRHLAEPNLSPAAKTATFNLLAQLSQLADTLIFFFVGENIVLYAEDFDWQFILICLMVILVGRALNIFNCSFLLNRTGRRNNPVPWGYQVVMWHSGLRGAMAYALTIAFPSHNRGMLVNSCSMIILFTVFVLGGSTNAMLDLYNIEKGVDLTVQKDEDVEAETRARSGCKARFLDFVRHSKRFLLRPGVRPRSTALTEQERRESGLLGPIGAVDGGGGGERDGESYYEGRPPSRYEAWPTNSFTAATLVDPSDAAREARRDRRPKSHTGTFLSHDEAASSFGRGSGGSGGGRPSQQEGDTVGSSEREAWPSESFEERGTPEEVSDQQYRLVQDGERSDV
jgi:sodium/hydrogen exchanger 8